MAWTSRRAALIYGVVLGLVFAIGIAAVRAVRFRPTATASTVQRDSWRRAQTGPILESVFKYLIAHHHSDGVYFLNVVTRDAAERRRLDRDLLLRLKHNGFAVEPGSHLVMRRIGDMMTYVDRYTGRVGLSFSAGPVRWLGDTAANVDGGGQAGVLSGAYGVFHVVRSGNEWKVNRFTMTMQL